MNYSFNKHDKVQRSGCSMAHHLCCLCFLYFVVLLVQLRQNNPCLFERPVHRRIEMLESQLSSQRMNRNTRQINVYQSQTTWQQNKAVCTQRQKQTRPLTNASRYWQKQHTFLNSKESLRFIQKLRINRFLRKFVAQLKVLTFSLKLQFVTFASFFCYLGVTYKVASYLQRVFSSFKFNPTAWIVNHYHTLIVANWDEVGRQFSTFLRTCSLANLKRLKIYFYPKKDTDCRFKDVLAKLRLLAEWNTKNQQNFLTSTEMFWSSFMSF